MNKTYGDRIDEALGDVIQEHAGDNCLPYLIWTGMFEGRMRDSVACRLLSHASPPNLYVCREFAASGVQRVDLAVADSSGKPVALVEFKQMYTYDIVKEASKRANTARALGALGLRRGAKGTLPRPKSFFARVIRDACKLNGAHTASVEKYVVLVAAHLDISVPTSKVGFYSKWYLKYANEVQGAYNRAGVTAPLLLNQWHIDVQCWPPPSPTRSLSNEDKIYGWFGSPVMTRVDRWTSHSAGARTFLPIGKHGTNIEITWRIWRVS